VSKEKQYSEMTIIALVEAFKIRENVWPEKCTKYVLQAIDIMALYLAEDVCEHYGIQGEDVEEHLEMLEEVLV
jgi:hypothetical protein